MTRLIARHVVEATKHEQVRDKSKPKHDQYNLCCFGISNGRSCKMRVWRNLDHGSPSWTLRLEGPGWRASVLDCPDLSAGSLTGGKIALSPEPLNFCKTDAETATVTAHEVEHTLASHEAEMLVQDLCLVIDRIQMVEQRRETGFFSSIPPRNGDDHAGSLPCNQTKNASAVSCDRIVLLNARHPFTCLYHIAEEVEADYICPQPIASAGYNPRAAPARHEKQGPVESNAAC